MHVSDECRFAREMPAGVPRHRKGRTDAAAVQEIALGRERGIGGGSGRAPGASTPGASKLRDKAQLILVAA